MQAYSPPPPGQLSRYAEFMRRGADGFLRFHNLKRGQVGAAPVAADR